MKRSGYSTPCREPSDRNTERMQNQFAKHVLLFQGLFFDVLKSDGSIFQTDG
jgi:hypothetical protein